MADGNNRFRVSIAQCRNIVGVAEDAIILSHHHLHLFLAKNGTGKTTISRALRYCSSGSDSDYEILKSFEYLETENDALLPVASCTPRLKSLAIFDSEWIDDHCFTESSVHEGAFELYVSDKVIKKKLKKRNSILGRLNKLLFSPDLEKLEKQIQDINKKIGSPTGGNFRSSAPCVRALDGGVPLHPIPSFAVPILRSMSVSEQAKWLFWHTDRPVMHSEGICPYCGTYNASLIAECQEYDDKRESKKVKAWFNLAVLFDEIKGELNAKVRARLRSILTRKAEPTEGDLAYLAQTVQDNSAFLDALEEIRSAIGSADCFDGTTLVTRLRDQLKLVSSFSFFLKTKGGAKTSQGEILNRLISALNGVINAEAELTQASDELQQKTALNVDAHRRELNAFLKQCGYPYQITIDKNLSNSRATVVLQPLTSVDSPRTRTTGNTLSYGEKNALALALFTIECIHEKPSLIVLDDPISSFDSDKRFGILYALFSNQANLFKENFSGKTVLVLTHDYLVAADLVAIHDKKFNCCEGSYLYCDELGILHRDTISKDAIRPYTQMLRERIRAASNYDDSTLCLVYIRQLCEMLRQKPGELKTKYGIAFSLISEILHGRDAIEVMSKQKWQSQSNRTVKLCERLVHELSGLSFDFWQTLSKHSHNTNVLINEYKKSCYSNYERLQLTRWIIDRAKFDTSGESIMKRFTDETCHIGGEYLYQLDPVTFDQTPFYIVAWCDEIVAKIENSATVTATTSILIGDSEEDVETKR